MFWISRDKFNVLVFKCIDLTMLDLCVDMCMMRLYSLPWPVYLQPCLFCPRWWCHWRPRHTNWSLSHTHCHRAYTVLVGSHTSVSLPQSVCVFINRNTGAQTHTHTHLENEQGVASFDNGNVWQSEMSWNVYDDRSTPLSPTSLHLPLSVKRLYRYIHLHFCTVSWTWLVRLFRH